jgi:hypothetical protein
MNAIFNPLIEYFQKLEFENKQFAELIQQKDQQLLDLIQEKDQIIHQKDHQIADLMNQINTIHVVMRKYETIARIISDQNQGDVFTTYDHNNYTNTIVNIPHPLDEQIDQIDPDQESVMMSSISQRRSKKPSFIVRNIIPRNRISESMKIRHYIGEEFIEGTLNSQMMIVYENTVLTLKAFCDKHNELKSMKKKYQPSNIWYFYEDLWNQCMD